MTNKMKECHKNVNVGQEKDLHEYSNCRRDTKCKKDKCICKTGKLQQYMTSTDMFIA